MLKAEDADAPQNQGTVASQLSPSALVSPMQACVVNCLYFTSCIRVARAGGVCACGPLTSSLREVYKRDCVWSWDQTS